MERRDMHRYERVDYVAKKYFQLLMSHRPDHNVFAFVKSPHGKEYRERFQAFAFMRGMQYVTKRTWYIRTLENDPPDFEAVSPKPAPGISATVENVSIPKQTRKVTADFSPQGIATFLVKKKPPSKLGDKTILAVYLNATFQIDDVSALSRLVQQAYKSPHEIWLHAAVDPSREQWFVQRLAPDCLKQEFYALWPPEATRGYKKM